MAATNSHYYIRQGDAILCLSGDTQNVYLMFIPSFGNSLGYYVSFVIYSIFTFELFYTYTQLIKY